MIVTFMNQRRELNKEEIILVEYLAGKAKYQLEKNWYNGYKALTMNDGGMGSILLIPDNLPQQERVFKAQIADCVLKDVDNMDIIVSLNIDQNDYLFELDIWKCDYTSVKKIVGLQDLYEKRDVPPCVVDWL